jgi:hypothetical protein
MLRALLAALVVFVLSLSGRLAPSAQAATSCTSTISGTTIVGNLVVPAGATCNLDNVTVTGNVSVQANAELDFTQSGQIGGNLTATNASHVFVNAVGAGDIRIAGNVSLTGVTGRVSLLEAQVGGNYTVKNSGSTTPSTIANNRIGGNLVFQGTTNYDVSSNQVNGILSCSGNTNINGNNNTANGGKFGQCKNF